jgi:hypothetical protein
MKDVVKRVAQSIPLQLEESISPAAGTWREQYGLNPVLLVDRKKAAKYRVGEEDLEDSGGTGPNLRQEAGRAGRAGWKTVLPSCPLPSCPSAPRLYFAVMMSAPSILL